MLITHLSQGYTGVAPIAVVGNACPGRKILEYACAPDRYLAFVATREIVWVDGLVTTRHDALHSAQGEYDMEKRSRKVHLQNKALALVK